MDERRDDRRVLVLTRDEELLDDLVRLAAAAGCPLERAPDVAGARLSWASAALVLVDEAGAAQTAGARLPRRERVVVVCRDEPPSTVWERAVAAGAEQVVSLPDGEGWLVSALTDAAEGAGRPGRVLAVLGGRGGAGASVLATAVAVAALAAGEPVLLVDCDPMGGGLDLVLGAEDATGLRWPGLALSGGRVAASSLHAALPSLDGELTVLSCDRTGDGPQPDAVAAVVESGRRAGETVVCDLPRHLTDAALAVLDSADLVVLVVPAEVRACAAAARVAERVVQRGVAVQVVVRGPAPGGLSPDDVAGALGLPLLTSMRPQPGLSGALDRGQVPGRGRGPLARAAAEVLDVLQSVGRPTGAAA